MVEYDGVQPHRTGQLFLAFGAAPVTNTGGVLSDVWSPEQRGAAIVGYAMAVVGGPVLGPIVGGAICQSYLGWRWTQYVSISSIQH